MLKKLTLLFIVLLTLSACRATQSELTNIRDAEIRKGLRFGDSDPQYFGKRTPKSHPVHGIDISKWQQDIDWRKVKRSGIDFAFIKATEGGDFLDPQFHVSNAGARRVNIPTGAYHFYYFCRTAIDQANWFIENVPVGSTTLPPVLDIEWNNHSKTCKKRPSPENVLRQMEVFLELVSRHYGQKPLIYTTVDFHRENLVGKLKGYHFWLRSVAAHPSKIYKRPWKFWQYTGTGIVPGIKGSTDINIYNGTKKSWKKWLTTSARNTG